MLQLDIEATCYYLSNCGNLEARKYHKKQKQRLNVRLNNMPNVNKTNTEANVINSVSDVKEADVELSDFCDETEGEPVFSVTSPRRKFIRKNVTESLAKNAERMKVKYSKKKRIKVADYAVGDKVTVKIPKLDRNSTDSKRLKGIIVKKSAGCSPIYRIICAHGTLQNRYSASDLMPFHGIVDVGNVDNFISLREAAKATSKSDVVFCRCKKSGCKSNICKCYKNKQICSSRCHRGASNCLNLDGATNFDPPTLPTPVHTEVNKQKTKLIVNDFQGTEIILPLWGGELPFGAQQIKMVNTCSIDNWLFLLSHLIAERPATVQKLKELYSEEKSFLRLMRFISNKLFSAAKFHISIANKMLPSDKNIIDFFGNEKIQFLDNNLCFMFKHTLLSTCDSSFCPTKDVSVEYDLSVPFIECGYVDLENTGDKISPLQFQAYVESWFTSIEKGNRCGRLCESDVPVEFTFGETSLE